MKGNNFLSINSNYNDFSSFDSKDINKYLLENQEVVLSKVYGFMQRPDDLLLVTGFFGTGKTQVVKHLLNYLDKSVFSFNINCSQSMQLDDLLLFLWEQFISYQENTEIAYHYRHVKSFQDKIVGCFSELKSNLVITLFDFDLIQDSNYKDILDFIIAISNNEKIKLIIISKTFDTSLIPEDITYTKVILKALSRLIFEKYLQDKAIKATPRIFDELYKITRGYYFYTEITSLILLKKDLSVSDFLVAYTNSGMSFDKFLAKAFISMLPDDTYNLLTLLSLIRHPVNSQLLDYFEAFDDLSVEYLKQNKFIRIENGNLILSNYFRNSLLAELSDDIANKIHLNLFKFYNSQLPLKPSERLILLSRITMRSEIEYHSSFFSNSDKSNSDNNSVVNVENMSSEDLYINATNLFDDFNYNDALKYYLELLNRDDVKKTDVQLKLALLYEKIGNWKYALHYYFILVKYYQEVCDNYMLNSIKLNIAKIYYQSYKTNDAIKILSEIISSSSDVVVAVEAYTILGNIYISLSEKNKAYELYSKAVVLANKNTEIKNLPELYFKFAILADENENTNIAVEYYNNCINVSDDSNKYKSLAYSNLADLYLDFDKKQIALEKFKAAFDLDLKNENNYGIYYTSSNIAKLLVNTNPIEAYEYLKQAKKFALKTDDIFAMANSGLHLGDYYSNNNKIDLALNEYFSVLDLVRDKFNDENKRKILLRIDDIKLKIGEDKYNELFANKNK